MELHQLAKKILKSQTYYSLSGFTIASLSEHLKVCEIKNLDEIVPVPHILFRLNTDLIIKYSTKYNMFEEGSFNSILNVKFPGAITSDIQDAESIILSQEQANQFLETFERLLLENDIEPEGLSSIYNTTHLDNLLALSYVFQEINDKYKQQEERQRELNRRGSLLVSLLKLPFKKLLKDEVVWLERKYNGFGQEEVGFKTADLIKQGLTEKDVRKHSIDKPFFFDLGGKQLEFSTDIKISINSTHGTQEIDVDQAFKKKVIEALVINLIDEIKVSDNGFYDQLCTWDGDVDQLKYRNENSIKDLFTRKITACSIIIIDYLNQHELLRGAKAKNVSQSQSAFLFKYFALFDVLEKNEDYELDLKKAQEVNRRRHIDNPFQDSIDAQVRSYKRPFNYIKETIKDNLHKVKE